MNKSSRLEQIFVRLAPILIAVAGVLLIFLMIQLDKTNYAVKETAAYTRVSNCMVAKVLTPPTVQEDVEKCYTQVEKDSGISLERFDYQINNENINRDDE